MASPEPEVSVRLYVREPEYLARVWRPIMRIAAVCSLLGIFLLLGLRISKPSAYAPFDKLWYHALEFPAAITALVIWPWSGSSAMRMFMVFMVFVLAANTAGFVHRLVDDEIPCLRAASSDPCHDELYIITIMTVVNVGFIIDDVLMLVAAYMIMHARDMPISPPRLAMAPVPVRQRAPPANGRLLEPAPPSTGRRTVEDTRWDSAESDSDVEASASARVDSGRGQSTSPARRTPSGAANTVARHGPPGFRAAPAAKASPPPRSLVYPVLQRP